MFVRRVAINFDWVAAGLQKLRGAENEKDVAVTARLDALKKNKAALDDSLERRRASVRFEPTATESQDRDEGDVLEERPSTSAKPTPATGETTNEGPSYTERLLEAKRKAKKK